MPSHWELIVLAVVLLLLFGSKRVPEVARTLGRSARELKGIVSAADPREDVRRALDDEPSEAREARRDPHS